VKVLQCHNFYQQPGGEDQVFHDEAHLLRANGHEVIQFTRHNDAIRDMPSWKVALDTIWNRETCADLRQVIREERPAVVHFTNTFPLISPAAYSTARKAGAKVVQSLHNYRLLCPNAQFLRDGRPCESCVGRMIAWPAVQHACYRNDRRSTAVVAAMLAFHRSLGTWHRAVDLYLALTEFGRRKFIEGGLPAEKIAVKPNFIRVDPGIGDGSGGYAVFVGRLSPEKGIETILNAWSQLEVDLPLNIVGDGPLADRVREAADQNPRIRWLGHQSSERVLEIVGGAKLLLLPSLWYEGLPKIIVEAFSKGTPVVASNLGAMTELIEHERNGMLFTPGDSAALAAAVRTVHEDSTTLTRMRKAARDEFEEKFTAEANYKLLMAAYARVLGRERCEASDRADHATENAPADSAAAENLVASSL
jgi:glycosyltransferase involved in cell wall biosynthesis